MIINKCGENGGGENSGRKRAADGERQERSPPWRERHGKDGRRHGEQKKKDGGKETPAKKNGDGAQRKTGCGRRKRQKPRRCVLAGNAGSGDVGTYRQVRPTFQPAGGCYYKERIPLNLRAPPLYIPSLINTCALCRHPFILKNNGRTLSVRPYIPLLAGNTNLG